MRLLNTKSQELKDFVGKLPPYAILSHTWEEEEVLFQDIVNHTGNNKLGRAKIVKACSIAAQSNFQWIWIDTCCIDKSSSAELSEAINSMFRWYREYTICYAFLHDVHHDGQFKDSRWFTRGWTLQELIAPGFVLFLDQNLQFFGTKLSKAQEIESIMGIPKGPLCELLRSSVACKMSWAAKRGTTRIEDQPYSLLGLFDINMPLLYREAEKHSFPYNKRSFGHLMTSLSLRGLHVSSLRFFDLLMPSLPFRQSHCIKPTNHWFKLVQPTT